MKTYKCEYENNQIEVEEVHPVTSNEGKSFEIRFQDEDGLYIEFREKGNTEWREGLWSLFCESYNVNSDTLA